MNHNVSRVNKAMDLHAAFDVLSRVVEQFESDGRPVRDVEVTTAGERGGLRATMDVPVSLCSGDGSLHPALELRAATPDDGDGLRVECATTFLDDLPPSVAAAVTTEVRSARVTDDGIVLTVESTVDPAGDGSDRSTDDRSTEDARAVASATPSGLAEATGVGDADCHDGSGDPSDDSAPDGTDDGPAEGVDPALRARLDAVRDGSLPPYEDVAYLRALYDACETFVEMSRYIEMDVAAETVRRYMIAADVHSPTSYGTAGEESPAESDDERLLADGTGLPGDVRVEDVVDAVAESMSVYQVQRRLDLARRATLDLLTELDLLELVMHRVNDGPDRDLSSEEVAARLRERGGTSPAGT